MAERIKGLQIDLSLNDMGISKKLSDVKREFRSLNTSMKTSNNNFKYGDKSAASYKSRMNELQTAVEGSSKHLDQLKKRHAEVVQEQGAGSKAALNYADEINRESDTLNMYKDQLDRVTAAYRENYSFSGRLSKSFSSIGNGFKAVGAKAQSLGDSLTSHITKPAGIAAIAMAGITAKLGFDRLKGLDTAKAKLEGLGYSGKEVETITDQVTDAIKGGMTTIAEGTDIAAGALAAGVHQGKDLKKYIQLVGDAAAGANRPVGEMATIFNRVKGQGKLMTEELNSIEDGMPGFSRAMAKHYGVSMEKFREMVSDGKVQSKDFLDVMDDFAGNMAESYAQSLEGMWKNTKAYIGQIGEKFLHGVFQQAKGSLKEFEDLLSSKAVQTWAKNAGVSLAKGIGEIGSKIGDLVNWWKNLDGSTQKTLGNIAKWAGIVLIAIGPMLTMFGKVATITGSMFGGLSKVAGGIAKLGTNIKSAGSLMGGLASTFSKTAGILSAITSPIGLIVIGLVALGTALVVAYKKSETFRNIVNGAFNAIKDTLSTVWSSVIQPVLGGIAKLFGSVWKQIKSASDTILPDLQIIFDAVFKSMSDKATGFWNTIKTVFGFLSNVIQTIMPGLKAVVKNTFDGISNIISGAVNIIMGIVQTFAGLLSGDFKGMWEGIKRTALGFWDVIKGLFKVSFIGQMIAFVKGMYTTVLGWFSNLWKGAVNIFNGLKTSVIKIWTNIKNGVINLVKAWWSNVKHNFNVMKNGVTNIFNGVKNTVVKIWNTIKSKVSGLVGGMKDGTLKTVGKMRDGIKNIVDKIKGFFTGMVTAVKKGLNKLIDGVNWVGGKLGMGKIKKIKLAVGTDENNRSMISNGKLNRDTFATVGDKGRGNGPSGFRNEIIRYPNGKMAMTPDKDTTAYLPKGSSVMNGQQTYNALNGIPHFAKGSLWDKTKDFASGAFNKAKDAVGKGAKWLSDKVGDVMDWVSHPGKLVDKVIEAFGVNFDFIKGSLPKDLMSAMFRKLKTAVKDLFSGWFEEDESSGGSGKYKSLVKKALKMNGLPTGSRYVNAWMKQIQTESGGRANAVQGYIPGDPNNAPQNRARGLLQTVPNTFKANAFKGHGKIFEPLDNILAGIRYAKRRYGKKGMLQVIGHGHGYATGGEINTPGLYNLAEEKFGEYIIPKDPKRNSDAMKILSIAANDIENRKNKNKRPSQMRTPHNMGNNPQSEGDIELKKKLDTLISMFGTLLGLNDAQLKAIKDSSMDKSKVYKQMAKDMRIVQAQNFN